MAKSLRTLLLITWVIAAARSNPAQEAREITNTEPGVYVLADLFRRADTVALVKIVSGDTEAYEIAVYKAEVVRSFKGSASGRVIYFGPYVGKELGSEYFVFLRRVSEPLNPKTPAASGYGTIHYEETFNQGYSAMMTSYECVFSGKEIADQCGDAARVCTDYIKLPKAIPISPPMTKDTPFGCRWVRKPIFTSLLQAIGDSKEPSRPAPNK